MKHVYRVDESGLQFVSAATQIATEVAAKHAMDVDEKGRFPREAIDALGTAGLFGLCLSPDVGGKGQPPRVFAAIAEELGQACASTAMVYVMHISATQTIAAANAFAAKTETLKEIAAGKHLTTLALSERGSRSNFWLPVSKLERRGDKLLTNAAKSWVTSAGHANSYVSNAQKPDATGPTESVVYFAKRGDGVRVEGSFNGLGLRGNDSAPLRIEGHEVKKGDYLSDEGAGLKVMLEVVLPWFAVGSAAMANGLCRAAVGVTGKHLSGAGFDRAATGTPSLLRELPILRARIAEMSVRTEQARALLGYTLDLMDEPSEITPLFVLQSRLASIQAAVEVTDLAMKACGGAGFSKHLGVERLFRDARAGWVMAPTVHHLNDFVGKALTGMPLL